MPDTHLRSLWESSAIEPHDALGLVRSAHYAVYLANEASAEAAFQSVDIAEEAARRAATMLPPDLAALALDFADHCHDASAGAGFPYLYDITDEAAELVEAVRAHQEKVT